MAAARHILIVEDDPDLRAALVFLLVTEGYSVEAACDGVEAIHQLEEDLERGEPPCAVLVDLLMPGIIGNEILDYMRDDEQLSTIPTAIVTASPELAPDGYRVFRKPLDLEALREFVRVCPN